MNVGDTVPNFEAVNQQGETVSFYEVVGSQPAVLFFYPKAFTPGCTKESCHFRDLGAEYEKAGVLRIGISADTPERNLEFDTEHSLGYTLLSDVNKEVAKLFGVKRIGPIMNKRSTFAIGADHQLVSEFSSELNMERHADDALAALTNERT